jgi:hypothetical protein
VPYDRSRVRFRLFEEFDGFESLINEMTIPLVDLDADKPFMSQNLSYDRLKDDSLRPGEINGWFSFEGDIDDESASKRARTSSMAGIRSSTPAALKASRWDKVQSSSKGSGKAGSMATAQYALQLTLYAQRPEKEKARERARMRKEKLDKGKGSFNADKVRSPSMRGSFLKQPSLKTPQPFEVEQSYSL